MSRLITLSVLLFCFLFAGNRASGQSLADYNTWDFGTSIGLTYPRTDITGKGGKFGISFDGTKFLSHNFALQVRLIHATIAGEDMNRPDYQFNTTIHYDVTLNAILQSNKLIILPEAIRDKLGLYFSAGVGIVNYTPDIWLDGGIFTMHGIYSQYSQEYDTFNYSGSTDFMLPVAVGAKYHMSDNVSLNIEYSYRVTNTDKLDGFFKLLSNNDNYSFFNVGVIFHLGKKSKVLEWETPVNPAYSEIDAMKLKLVTLTRDTDGDGVPDYHDKEPSTPAGTQVYGDGGSVDTDNDGVPDARDEEPFTTKNLKVDASGKEIRPIVEPPPVVAVPVIPQPESTSSLPSIYFEYDSYTIAKKYKEDFRKIAATMKSDRNIKYTISGICDDKSKMHNIDLSNRRAEAVKNHLKKYYNISPDRLITEVQFVPPDPSAPSINRRVDVKVR